MCGITGFISQQPQEVSNLITSLRAIEHRGPDAAGIMIASDDGIETIISTHDAIGIEVDQKSRVRIGAGHTRFSIIDTSKRSNQPFEFNDKYLTFNGEIFNYIELREELAEFYPFVTDSDTEVVLKAYDFWGKECFKKFNGFWSIALIDLSENIVVLSRDRYGEKPLYVFESDGSVYWSSEIKALGALTGRAFNVSNSSALLYLAYDRRNTLTHSMYDGVVQIDPGAYKIFDIASCDVHREKSYYVLKSPQDVLPSNRFEQHKFEDLLLDSVKLRLRSDVPLAISLSGGLDSAALALAMRLTMPTMSITAYTIRYADDREFDESYLANMIAESLNIDLKVITIKKEDVWDCFDRSLVVAEEPTHSFATTTQLLSWEHIAERECKVLIHGSSADELLFGYQYLAEICDIDRIKSLKPVTRIQGNCLFHYKSLGRIAKWIVNGKFNQFANIESNLCALPFSQDFRSQVIDLDRHFIDYYRASHSSGEERRYADFSKLRIPYWCSLMDKNMMSVPLEVRSPFLDYRLVDYCMQFGSEVFYKDGYTKLPLRRFMSKYLPSEVVWNKTKIGFSAPIDVWMHENDKYVLKYITDHCDYYIDKQRLLDDWNHYDSSMKWRFFSFAKWIKSG